MLVIRTKNSKVIKIKKEEILKMEIMRDLKWRKMQRLIQKLVFL
jgi:hypothetical protein